MAIRQEGGSSHIAPPYTPGYEVVTFVWSSEHGYCYDCGMPAAFYLPRAYINETNNPGAPDQEPSDTNKRCAVCAANSAADGDTVRRIEDFNAPTVLDRLEAVVIALEEKSTELGGVVFDQERRRGVELIRELDRMSVGVTGPELDALHDLKIRTGKAVFGVDTIIQTAVKKIEEAR